MAEQWRISGGRNDDEDDDIDDSEPTDVALMNSGAGANLKCFKCGGRGHYARNCPTNNNGNERKCTFCGKNGHIDVKCVDNPENKDVPQWVKDKRGRSEANAASVEVLVASIEMEDFLVDNGIECLLGEISENQEGSLGSIEVAKTSVRKVKVGEVSAKVGKISAMVGGSKVAVSGVSRAKVGVRATSVASLSCQKMSVDDQKSEYGRVDSSMKSADSFSNLVDSIACVSNYFVSNNDQWVGDSGVTVHWIEKSANSEQGRVLEVAQNVANLDGLAKVLVSGAKASVTKKNNFNRAR